MHPPLGRSGCELGECSGGECAVMAATRGAVGRVDGEGLAGGGRGCKSQRAECKRWCAMGSWGILGDLGVLLAETSAIDEGYMQAGGWRLEAGGVALAG